MERFILKKLLEWKNSPYRKPLILKGVRQVGKTWILKEFGKRYYENTAYFNFDENEEYKQFFETTKDIDRILQNLILASGQKIVPEKTLIIFDEVQDCPKVINAMKYFCENAPQYHIACAGSLLGIALAKPSPPLSANCTAGTQEIIDEVKALMVSGEWDVFSGVKLEIAADGTITKVDAPLVDNAGNEIVAAGGASVEDGVITGTMNYFVAGVKEA